MPSELNNDFNQLSDTSGLDPNLTPTTPALPTLSPEFALHSAWEDLPVGMRVEMQSRFGITSAKGMEAFLESEGGRDLVGDIEKEFAEEEAMREQEVLESRGKEDPDERMIAFLLLYFAYLKESKAENLNEFIQRKIEEKLHKLHDKNEAEENRIVEMDDENKALRGYNNYLNDLALENKANLTQLETDQALHLESEERMKANHGVLNENIEMLDNFSEKVLSSSDAEAIDAIKEEISLLEKQLANDDKEAANLIEQSGNDYSAPRPAIDQAEGVRKRIQGLQELQGYVEARSSLGKDATFYNKDGEQTSSYRKASLVLKPDLHLVKDNTGNFLAIPRGKTLDQLSPAEKQTGKQVFNSSLKVRSMQNETQKQVLLDLAANSKKLSALDDRSDNIQKEMQQVANQKRDVQAAIGTIQQFGLTKNFGKVDLNKTPLTDTVNINSNINPVAPGMSTVPTPNNVRGTMMDPAVRRTNTTRANVRTDAMVDRQNLTVDNTVARQNIALDSKVEIQNKNVDARVEVQNTKNENQKAHEDNKEDNTKSTAPTPYGTIPRPY